MKKALIILDYYLPNASANGICVSKIVDDLLDKKIDVSIICFGDQQTTDFETTSSRENGLRVYYVDSPKIPRVFPKESFYLRWIFANKHLPTERSDVYKNILLVAERIVEENNIDTVICVHLPIETIRVGVTLKKKHPDLNVVAYMLDSLSGGHLLRFLPRKFCSRKKILWENRMLSHFDRVILMESSRKHHEANSATAEWYQNSCYLDVPALSRPLELEGESVKDREEVVISFVGTIQRGIRTPYALFKVLSNISDLKVRFVIAGKNKCDDLRDFFKESENVSIDVRGEIPYKDAQQLIADSDFLVNLGNESSNLVPSKIFEYMSYGKPIISTFNCDADSSIPYLKKYPAVCLIDERKCELIDTSKQLGKFMKENRDTRVPYEMIEKRLYNNCARAFSALLLSDAKGKKDEDE